MHAWGGPVFRPSLLPSKEVADPQDLMCLSKAARYLGEGGACVCDRLQIVVEPG